MLRSVRGARQALARCGAAGLSRRRSRGPWSKNLLESVPEHSVGSPFSARRILVCANHGAVNDRRRFVDIELKLAKHLGPDVLGRPVAKPVVDGLPVAEPLRKVSPLDARPGSEQHSVDEQPVAACGLSSWCPDRNQWPQSIPLLIGQRVPLHTQL